MIEVINHQTLKCVAHGFCDGGLYAISSFISLLRPHELHLHQLFASPKALLSKEDYELWHYQFGLNQLLRS